MYIEKINGTSTSGQFTHGNLSFHQEGKAFRDVLQWNLPASPKPQSSVQELTGILVPLYQRLGSGLIKFKLESKSENYFLRMNRMLEILARKVEWEEVVIKGVFHFDGNTFEVQKITLKKSCDSIRKDFQLTDSGQEMRVYEEAIAKLGKIDPAIDYLFS